MNNPLFVQALNEYFGKNHVAANDALDGFGGETWLRESFESYQEFWDQHGITEFEIVDQGENSSEIWVVYQVVYGPNNTPLHVRFIGDWNSYDGGSYDKIEEVYPHQVLAIQWKTER